MLLERLLENLAVDVEAFATCRVAPGWRLRLPPLDWVTFHFVVGGRGQVTGGAETALDLEPGSLAVVPPHLLHAVQCGPPPHAERSAGSADSSPLGLPEHRAGLGGGSEPGSGLVVVCGRVQVVYGGGIGLFDRLDEVLVMDFDDGTRAWGIFESLRREVERPGPGGRALVSALMSEALVHLFRRLCDPPDCGLPWLGALEDPDLADAVGEMLDNPGGSHTVATLAALCHMSRSTFARRFRDCFGQPPMEYLRAIRLRHAARLLRKDPSPSVAAVARRVGFSSRSQFSRAFKEHFDRSPSAFSA